MKFKINEKEMEKRGFDKRKMKIVERIVNHLPSDVEEMFISGKLEIIGLCERVTYHKVPVDELEPYTHIFNHPTIVVKVKDKPILLIVGESIVYQDNFIDD